MTKLPKNGNNKTKKIPTRVKDETRLLLLEAYNLLYKAYGPRHWWPAEHDFEVVVGAILTQNTNWANVEKAINNLKKEKLLSLTAIHNLRHKTLARLIRPCGYYNVKARRLKNAITYLFSKYSGNLAKMRRLPTEILRRELLGVKGLGPETADSILLYALNKPVFVVDAYTRRIMSCRGVIRSSFSYDQIQEVFMGNLPVKAGLFNEYHALLVEHAKRVCKVSPRCQECILRMLRSA